MNLRNVFVCAVVSLGLGAFSSATRAEQTIVSAKITPLPLYATPDDATPVKSITPAGMPWSVKNKRGDFYEVTIEGNDYWIDSETVRASQKVVASCGVSAGSSAVAGVLGASTDRCK